MVPKHADWIKKAAGAQKAAYGQQSALGQQTWKCKNAQLGGSAQSQLGGSAKYNPISWYGGLDYTLSGVSSSSVYTVTVAYPTVSDPGQWYGGLNQYVLTPSITGGCLSSVNYQTPAVTMPTFECWTVPVETPEEKAVRERRAAERAAAEIRAEALLVSCLDKAQAIQYLERGYFDTAVDDRVYRINRGRQGNVVLLENGKPKFKYCAHPGDRTPAPDAMLAQLLMLRTNEQNFLKIANRTVLA